MAQINQTHMLPIGTELDHRYKIERCLASGGFGNTYVAEDLRLWGQVAVKEFFMRGTNHRSQDGTTVEVSNEQNTPIFNAQMDKFRREARRIFKLHNDHIIHVSDLFDVNGTSYYVMDFIPGTSLAEQIKQQPLSEQEALNVVMQVLDALETMHTNGLYHLDVKPGNIMRDGRGHCTLIDFGASKQLSVDSLKTLSSSTMAYTPGYAPLEQVQQNTNSIGPWTDFFALGATIYKLVTGNPPPLVEADDIEPDGRQFPYPPTVSPHLRHAISTMMNAARKRRPQNVAEVRELLNNVPPPPLPPKTPVEDEQTHLDNRKNNRGTDEKTRREPNHPSPVNPTLQNLISNMVEVEGGTFMMGEKHSWLGGIGEDNKEHQVTLSSFAIGRTPVTQREWQAVMGDNPSHFKGDDLPVENVSWEDCQKFIRKLNEMTGMTFRLPTEAEWEFAARGGNKSKGYKYSGSDNIDDVVWYINNSGNKTHPVGKKSPNELGLYDMSGNVWEWCQDWYDRNYYNKSPNSNPCNNIVASARIRRGGCWSSSAGRGSCYVAFRSAGTPDHRDSSIGLRLAR